MDGDAALLDLLFTRLAESGLSDEVVDVVLAAYAGDGQLRAVLAGETPDLPAPEEGERRRPDPLYLQAVTVAGFRGIGMSADLQLQPHPGLTLVVGRNGSGKSSFAEAVELALTGDSARWAERNSVFREGWRNLHNGSPCQIELVLRADGTQAPIRIRHAWRDDHTDPGQAVSSVNADGRRYADTGELGWRPPLETYRPFLTANDLGRLVSSTPSGLFDALAPILGIEPVTKADGRLMQVRREIDGRLRALKDRCDALRQELTAVDDERARAATTLLAKRRPDLDALDKLLLANQPDGGPDPAVAASQRVSAASLPAMDDVTAGAVELDAAAQAARTVAASRSGTVERAARLLDDAVRYHEAHGDGPCPVCGAGTLDAAWRTTATRELEQLRTETAASREANERLDRTRRRALELLGLDRLLPLDAMDAVAGVPELERDQLRTALAAWRAIPADVTPERLAEHLAGAYAPLHAAFTAVQSAADEWLRRRHDAWREPAAALQTWLGDMRAATRDEAALGLVKKARDWLRHATDELRTDRLAPFAKQSQVIWERLRQESNVELSGMRLDGTATRRRVAFPATVDGSATSAMAVMSQGELQALGLAVFLPRACADDSPFRFLIIDDPVQSMDPSKVDGLAQVLAELALTRQVVVFTHDNRLPEAIRRLRIEATAWEVTRRDGSVVEIRKNSDPVARYLADAASLMKAGDLAENVRYPLVSGFCRSAVEAACHEHIRRDRIGRGERHADVEELIERALTLNQVAALALFGDMHRGGDVLGRINRFGRWAGDAFQACKEGVHGSGKVELPVLVADTRRLTEQLR